MESSKKQATSPTFCVLPWLHLATRTYGDITPCCVGEPVGENLNNTDFSTAFNSPSIRKLRLNMLKGKASPICKRCYDEEKTGIASHRLRSNKHWKKYSFQKLSKNTDQKGFFKGKPVYIDMRLGNLCNLECTMCSPQETVRWESLSQKIYNQAQTQALKNYYYIHNVFAKTAPSKKWYQRPAVKKDLYNQIPYLKKLTLAGGEPLLIKEHESFLDQCLFQNEAHHIELHYHTNGTYLKDSLFEKWSRFKQVILFISLDGIKERNRYIRYPSLWKRIEQNMETLSRKAPPNVHCRILCTVQIKNIFYFEELATYLQKFKNFAPWTDDLLHVETVHQPYFLCVQVLPQKAKKIITQKFNKIYKKLPFGSSRYKSIIDFMNAEDKSKFLYIFKDYIRALDKVRGTDFKKTFPEMAELLD